MKLRQANGVRDNVKINLPYTYYTASSWPHDYWHYVDGHKLNLLAIIIIINLYLNSLTISMLHAAVGADESHNQQARHTNCFVIYLQLILN